MSEFDRKPVLRFKGFTETWEQRKLLELVDYCASPLTSSSVTNEGKYDLYDANNVIGKIDNHIMTTDYITVIKDGAGVGRLRKLPKNTAFIGTMGALIPKLNDISYIYEMLKNRDLSKSFSGSTIPHIYFKDYGNEDYFSPKLKEQIKIGLLFNNLDSLITLHQRKENNERRNKYG